MTRRHQRHLRLVWEPEAEKPWIVQYCATQPHVWSDTLRFRQHGEATRYLKSVRERDSALLEAER